VHRSIPTACCLASAVAAFGLAAALPAYAGQVQTAVRASDSGEVGLPQASPSPDNSPTIAPPTTPPPTTTAPSPTDTATTSPPAKPKPTRSTSPSSTPKRTVAPTRAPVRKTPAYTVPTYPLPPEARPTLEPGDLEEEDEPADETKPPVALRSTPSVTAKREIAFVILGVGGAALLGLGGIVGLYFTRAQPVTYPPVDGEDGESADGAGTEME
jgi:outer membrane biosynthesis protein TonB